MLFTSRKHSEMNLAAKYVVAEAVLLALQVKVLQETIPLCSFSTNFPHFLPDDCISLARGIALVPLWFELLYNLFYFVFYYILYDSCNNF